MPERSVQRIDRTPATGERVAVAAARQDAVDAALTVLEAGGNAIDAAVACGFAAAVVEPMDTGVAGSGFLLVHDPADGRAHSVEFPSRAPLKARPDMFRTVSAQGFQRLVGVSRVADDANAEGPLACGVPGLVAGLLAAHERFGRLPRATVMAPAIALAHDGFAVDSYYALQTLASAGLLAAQPTAARTFLTANGLPPPVPRFVVARHRANAAPGGPRPNAGTRRLGGYRGVLRGTRGEGHRGDLRRGRRAVVGRGSAPLSAFDLGTAATPLPGLRGAGPYVTLGRLVGTPNPLCPGPVRRRVAGRGAPRGLRGSIPARLPRPVPLDG